MGLCDAFIRCRYEHPWDPRLGNKRETLQRWRQDRECNQAVHMAMEDMDFAGHGTGKESLANGNLGFTH